MPHRHNNQKECFPMAPNCRPSDNAIRREANEIRPHLTDLPSSEIASVKGDVDAIGVVI